VNEPALRLRQARPDRAAPGGPPVLELRGVGLSYPGQGPPAQAGGPPRRRPGQPRLARHRVHWPPAALSGIDLTVRPGELVTVTGPAQSGKTTLLKVVALLLRPTTGSYLLNGLDTARLRDRGLAALRGREIGLVCQPAHLLAGRSVLDNVMLPLIYAGRPERARRGPALAGLDLAGLGAQAHRLVSELSAAERQRTAIARALVTAPRLLICDDPTAGLDPDQAVQVIALLTSLRSAGCTVLVATGDQLAAAHGSRCLRLGDGAPGGPPA